MQPRPGLQLPIRPTATRARLTLKPTPEKQLALTGCEVWEATAMATGLDLIVGFECAMVVTAATRAYEPVARFANPALIVAFLWSACLCVLGRSPLRH
jgi:hypothetical protein